jgi:hypothetical protein
MDSQSLLITVLAAVAAFAGVLAWPRPASAHCDTEAGPTATDGRRALETGNVNHALKWVTAESERQVRAAFDVALADRAAGGEVAQRADHGFLETLVRIHRAGEGAGFDGLKPADTPIEPVVAAADRCIEVGSLAPLKGLVPDDRMPELERRFDGAMSVKDFDVDDVPAGRAWVDAYVAFFKYAEGEDHEHEHHAPVRHGHDHHH